MSELSRSILDHLTKVGQTVATAESVTGGELAAALTAEAGASHVFKGGLIAYSKESKIRELSVPSDLIEQFSVYSPQVAHAMALGARTRFEVDWAISATGVAGPGSSHGIAPGRVWVAIVGAQYSAEFELELSGTRENVRSGAVSGALSNFARILGL